MSSQTDLDQGGTNRQWERAWMGPTVGYVWRPIRNELAITAAGTYSIDPSTNYITVNVAGSVTITLPTAKTPSVPRHLGNVLPALFQLNPISIYEIGGNAGSFPITIQPLNNLETILGLTSIQLSVNYGSYTLQPDPTTPNWVNLA